MTITSKAVAKVAAVATGLAMATSMLSLAPIAHAASCSVGTANLTIGSTGPTVMCLQQTLIAAGFSIPAGATGYFGTQTRTAVSMWQKSANIAPAVGFFGPISRGALAAGGTNAGGVSGSVPGCGAGAMYSSTTGQACGSGTSTGSLTGTGRLTNLSSYGAVTSDIKEGDPATAVVGLQADATGGDVAVQRVDATFYVDDVSSQSSNLNQYVSDVSVWLNGTKLASMDPSLADKSGRVWTMRFSGLNGVIKSGMTGNIVVKVTPLTSVGTTEDGKSIIASILANGVRAIGADGISDTYISTSPTVTQNSASLDTLSTTGGAVAQRFTVSSATTGTLTVSAAGDNPRASQVSVSSSTTTGVKLLSFNMKAKNSSVKVTDIVAQFATSDNNLSDVVNTVYLMKGSTVLKSSTLSTGTTGNVTFSNVNQTIAKDDTANYTIIADIKGDSAYADGVTLVASTTVSGWDVSDANGASVTPSAAAVGNTITLTATGVSVALGTPTATVQTASFSTGVDTASYAIPFTVTAGDTDVFIAGAANNATGNTANKINYGTTTTSTQGATGQPTATVSVASTITGDSAGSYYKVLAGTSRTFTLNVALTASSSGVTAGYAGVQINSIAYGTVAGTEGSYYTANLDTFKTNDVYVQKH